MFLGSVPLLLQGFRSAFRKVRGRIILTVWRFEKAFHRDLFLFRPFSTFWERTLESVVNAILISSKNAWCEPVMQRNDKTNFRRKIRIEDNSPTQHFQKAFQIGLCRSEQCFSSREERFSSRTSKLWWIILHSNFEIKHANICTGIFGPKALTNGKQVFSCPALWITFRKRCFSI